MLTDTQKAAFLNILTASTEYLGLITAVTDLAAGTVTEVSGGSYARQSLSAKFPTATGSTTSNNTDIVFPEATGTWGTITHCGIWSADTGGTLRAVIELTAATSITTGQVARFNSGQVTLAGQLS